MCETLTSDTDLQTKAIAQWARDRGYGVRLGRLSAGAHGGAPRCVTIDWGSTSYESPARTLLPVELWRGTRRVRKE